MTTLSNCPHALSSSSHQSLGLLYHQQMHPHSKVVHRHQDASAEDGVSSRIQEFDRQHVGVSQPAKPPIEASTTGRQARAQAVDTSGSAGPAEQIAQRQDAAATDPGPHVQVCSCASCNSSLILLSECSGQSCMLHVAAEALSWSDTRTLLFECVAGPPVFHVWCRRSSAI